MPCSSANSPPPSLLDLLLVLLPREHREEEIRLYKKSIKGKGQLEDSTDVADRQPVFLKDKGDALYKQGNFRSVGGWGAVQGLPRVKAMHTQHAQALQLQVGEGGCNRRVTNVSCSPGCALCVHPQSDTSRSVVQRQGPLQAGTATAAQHRGPPARFSTVPSVP